jgi:internalin A
MVLGNGRVGKTQLCRRLRDLPYDETIPSTHGVFVDTFPLSRGAATDFAKVHLWDFGGQDIYHGTHALFLRANAIFALVWTPGFESGTHEHGGLIFRNFPLRYWVDYTSRLTGRDAATLIVQTRCDSHADRRTCPVDDAVLQNAFPSGYHDVLQFSARNARGLPALRDKLNEAIGFLRETQGVARIGASRQRVKARLEAMRNEDAKREPADRLHRWLTRNDFERICEEEKLVSKPAFLLDYLHNVGVVFYRKSLFEDRVILDQGWALEAIYAVFNRDTCFKPISQWRGRFTRTQMEALVWRNYSTNEQQLFIGMMMSCGVCFQIRKADIKTNIEAEYIAPDLLPERREVQIDLDALWHGEGEIESAVYAYDLLHPGMIRSIISRIGSQAGVSALYWRDGLCVYESSTAAHALIEQETDEGWAGRIILRARGGRAAELLSRLRELVEEEQRRIGLTPRESPAADRADSMHVDTDREDDHDARSLTFSPEPRKKPRYYVSYAWKDTANPHREREVDRLCAEADARGTPIIRDKTAMTFGDRISKFMTALAQGDRVFVFLSDKYLKSEFCMFELFETWRNCRHDEEEFAKRVRLYTLGDASILTPTDRLKRARYWRNQHDELTAELKAGHPSDLGERDFKKLKLMQDFAHHVCDILALFADTVNACEFDAFLSYGFDDPPS